MTPQNEDNVYEEFYENGQLKEKGNRSIDVYEIYYESGQLKARASDWDSSRLSKEYSLSYLQHRSNTERKFNNYHSNWGLYEEFYENGKLKFKYKYIDNYSFGFMEPKEKGEYKNIGYEHEVFIIPTIYRELELIGTFETYYENGNLKIKSNFIRDEKYLEYGSMGQCEEYFDNGQLKEKFINTKYGKTGPYEEYYENGVLKEKGIYLIENYYNWDDELRYISTKIGPFKSFYENGQLKNILIFNSLNIPNRFFDSDCYYDPDDEDDEEPNYNLEIRNASYYHYRPGESFESFYENGQLKIYFGINVPNIKNRDNFYSSICPFEEYYENGQLKIKTSLLKKEGIEYNLNKEFDIYYYNQIDLYEEYYESGQLKEKSIKNNGKIKDSFELYYESGQLHEKVNYNNDKEKPTHEVYYENGKLKELYTLRDGNMEGLCLLYYESGQLKEKFNYYNGIRKNLNSYNRKLDSLSYTEITYEKYYENGLLNEIYQTIGTKKNGLYKEFYENGQLKEESNYNNGELEGICMYYYKNGQLKEEVNHYREKKKRNNFSDIEYIYTETTYKLYFENGLLKEKYNLINSEKNGIYEEFYENGQPKEKANYKDGKIDGCHEVYTIEGNLEYLQY